MDNITSQVELDKCATEPIHIPGGIQPHGVLLVLAEPDFTINQTSNNSEVLLGVKPDFLLGQNLASLFNDEVVAQLKSYLLSDQLVNKPHFILKAQVKERPAFFDLIAHRYKGLTILELEPTTQVLDFPSPDFYNELLTKLGSAQTLAEFGQIACDEIHHITGFDHVMIYKFLEDNSGEVIAENREEFMAAYLGLRFPASDIPAQARQLYLTNRHRLIATAHYQPAALVPLHNPQTKQPLDMSYAVLRGISPIHLEYLKNMGVNSSQSISLVKNDKLWGLIACHHNTPHYLPFNTRQACEFLGQVIALHLTDIETREKLNYKANLKAIPTTFLTFMTAETNFAKGLTNYSPNLLDFISIGGAAVYYQGNFHQIGNTPSNLQLLRIIQWLNRQNSDEIFYTDSLPSVFGPEAENFKDSACGLLAFSLTKNRSDYVLLFRPEVEQTIYWSGDPSLAKTLHPKDNRLQPRKSFELWKEEVHLKSLPWQDYEVEAVSQLHHLILEVIVTRAEEMARLNAQLQVALAKEKELGILRARLVTSISHEFRTPLTVILSSSELLENYYTKLSDDKRKEIVGRLNEQVNRITHMLDDTLNLDKILEGEIAFKPSYINLTQFCQEFCLKIQSTITSNAKRLNFVAPEKPVWGNMDKNLLGMILNNLLSNAINFSSEKYQVILELETTPSDSEQEAIFKVVDKGIAIPVEDWPYIFEPYHRGKNVDQGNIQGTGVGLTIVQKAVELHKGKITFVSDKNNGTTFSVTLPLHEAEL